MRRAISDILKASMTQSTAVDVKEAVAAARHHLSELFPAGKTVQLEEVEPTQNSGWQVTFSYEPPDTDPLGIERLLPNFERKRVYKVVTVDASGRLQSVKIR